jgi:hypothetical protein
MFCGPLPQPEGDRLIPLDHFLLAERFSELIFLSRRRSFATALASEGTLPVYLEKRDHES